MYKIIVRSKGKSRTLKHRWATAEGAERYVAKHPEIMSASIREVEKVAKKPNLRNAVARLQRARRKKKSSRK